jgi:uncharacterized YccA/Bax inhibitor family protein
MFEANPAIRRLSGDHVAENPLSFNGVVHRTGVLLLLTTITFALTWRGLDSGEFSPAVGLVGTLVGLVLALIVIFTRATNPLLIGAYAITQGLALGAASYFMNRKYPGIALQAVAGTVGCFGIVLWLYSVKVLRATPMFVKVVTAAIIGIGLLYIVDLVAKLGFSYELGLLRGGTGLSIAITAGIVVIAAISFVIDFAAIEEAVQQGADAKVGWHFAFTLVLGLVWLYFSILRLLSNLRGRD